jgi:hypothetical protein
MTTDAYAGLDRRADSAASDASPAAVLRNAAIVVLGGAAVLLIGWRGRALGRDISPSGVVAFVGGATALMAVLAAWVFAVQWRISGDVAALRAAGACTVGGIAAAIAGTATSILPTWSDDRWIRAGRASATVVFLVLVALALLSPDVDTRVTPLGLGVRTVTGGAVTFVVSVLWTGAASVAAAPIGLVAHRSGTQWALVGAEITLALVAVVRWRSRGRWLTANLAAALVALALAEAMSMAAVGPADVRLVVAPFFEAVAFAFLLDAGVRELRAAYDTERRRAFEGSVRLAAVSLRERAASAAGSGRRHEARSLLLDVESAALLLGRYFDRLDDEGRRAVAQGLQQAIAKLQTFVTDGSGARPSFTVFTVDELLEAVADRQGWIRFDVDEAARSLAMAGDLSVAADALWSLLDSAVPDVEITRRVDARSTAGGVELRVALGDEEPGGLPVLAAVTLVRDLGGTLSIEDDGGPVAVVTLPGARRSSAATADPEDDIDDRGKARHRNLDETSVGQQRALLGVGVEEDDGLRPVWRRE